MMVRGSLLAAAWRISAQTGMSGLGAADVFLELFPIRPAPGLFCILSDFSSPATV